MVKRKLFKKMIGTALLGALLSGCAAEDATPTGAVRALFRAASEGLAGEVYERLAPVSQQQLRRLAERASAQTGGRASLRPQDMLAVGGMRTLMSAAGQAGDTALHLEVLQQTNERARVRVVGDHLAAAAPLECIKVDGRWRVILPQRCLDS